MTTEDKKLQEYIEQHWYISIFEQTLIVKKGRTKKKFKLSKYDNFDDLLKDINQYMSCEKNFGWK